MSEARDLDPLGSRAAPGAASGAARAHAQAEAHQAALLDLVAADGRRRRLRRIALLLAGLAGLGGVAWALESRSSAAAQGTVRVGPGPLRRVVAARGKVEAPDTADLSPRGGGRLAEVLVRPGDRVAAGDVVAWLENTDVQAAVLRGRAALAVAEARRDALEAGTRAEEVAMAEHELARARAELAYHELTLRRQEDLLRSNVTSAELVDLERTRTEVARAAVGVATERVALLRAGPRRQDLEAARAEVEVRRAEVAQAESLVVATQLRAPFDGVVTRRFLDPSEAVVPDLGIPVLRIAAAGRRRVRAEVDEDDVAFVREARQATVTAKAFPGRRFRGSVHSIGLEIGRRRVVTDDPGEMMDAKVLEVVVELEDGDDLPIGVVADVELVVVDREVALRLPTAAVIQGAGGPEVRVSRGGAVDRRRVSLGATDGGYVEVLSGLDEGDDVLGGR